MVRISLFLIIQLMFGTVWEIDHVLRRNTVRLGKYGTLSKMKHIFLFYYNLIVIIFLWCKNAPIVLLFVGKKLAHWRHIYVAYFGQNRGKTTLWQIFLLFQIVLTKLLRNVGFSPKHIFSVTRVNPSFRINFILSKLDQANQIR